MSTSDPCLAARLKKPRTGDLVIGDADGIMVIPQGIAADRIRRDHRD